MELEHEGAPVSVTLIRPSAIDTPYVEHARNYLDSPGLTVPPPVYDPHLVARAILHACENPKRDLIVGFGGWAMALMGRVLPRATDYVMEATMKPLQTTDYPGRQARRDNLYQPREDGAEHSSLPGGSRKTSLFLEAQMHPVATFALLAGIGLAAGYLLRPRKEDPHALLERRQQAARIAGDGQQDLASEPAYVGRRPTPMSEDHERSASAGG